MKIRSDWLFVWLEPRAWACFAVVVLVELVVRWPFHCIHSIPNYMEFRPDLFLVPLLGLAAGPAGAWGCFAASLLGDVLYRFWSPLSLYHATGLFFYSYSTWRLWAFSLSGQREPPALSAGWRNSIRFLACAFPGACMSAAWSGLGAELERLYPFAYYFGILLLQHLLFLFLLGPVFYQLMSRQLAGRLGGCSKGWSDHLKDGRCSLRSLVYILTGGMGAGFAGILLSTSFYGISLFRPAQFGSTSGPLMKAVVLGFLLLQAAGLFRKDQRHE
ncbi:MAG: hypothetical protein V2A34_14230 [Lentisphaerota bacterium]